MVRTWEYLLQMLLKLELDHPKLLLQVRTFFLYLLICHCPKRFLISRMIIEAAA
jgi:hypothetical protein